MSLIGTLNIGVQMFTDKVTKGTQSVVRSLLTLGKTAQSVQPMLTGLQTRLAGLVGIGAAGALTKYTLSLAAAAETSQVAFATMLRSQDAASQLIKEIRQFAKETPFQQQELLDASKQLLAFGFGAQEVVPWLRRLGDVASAVGAPIGDLAYLFGTARTQGRLYSVDIRQLASRGIPIIGVLTKQLGVSKEEFYKLVEAGKITAEEVEKAFITMTDAGGQFYDMTEVQSKTLAGRWSTLKDSVVLSLTEIGESLAKNFNLKSVTAQAIQLSDAIGAMIVPAIKSFGAFVMSIGPELIVFTGIIAALTAGFVAAQVAIKSTAVAMTVLQALSGPKGWFTLAVGLAAAKYGADFTTQLLENTGNTLAPQISGGLPNPAHRPPMQAPPVNNKEQQDINKIEKNTKEAAEALKEIPDLILKGSNKPEINLKTVRL